jgi:hypothetical protein
MKTLENPQLSIGTLWETVKISKPIDGQIEVPRYESGIPWVHSGKGTGAAYRYLHFN